MLDVIKSLKGYTLISNFYGDKTTKRSGVKLMNQIDEGIEILLQLDACIDTIEAYCVCLLYTSPSPRDS